jgi:hypothetical protein
MFDKTIYTNGTRISTETIALEIQKILSLRQEQQTR